MSGYICSILGRRSARLLYVINDADFFVSHRLTLAIAARDMGFDVHIATADGAGAKRVIQEGLEHHRISITRFGANPWREARTVLELYRLCRKLRPDLMHTVTIKGVIYGGIAARLTRVPALVSAVPGLGYVFTGTGLVAAFRRKAAKAAYRLALKHPCSRVIFQNPDDMAVFTRAKISTPEISVLIKGAGVDLSEFQLCSESQGNTVVVLASRLLWRKGVGEFVAAAARLRAEGVAARFVLVGAPDGGNPDSVSESQLRQWHRSGHIEWWGRRNDMAAIFRQAHIVCLPTYYGEGVPKVLIEAAASGRAIVATDWPGCREIVAPGRSGLLVPPRDVEALAGAIRFLIENPERRKAMGVCGRKIAESGFGQERVIEETFSVYAQLLQRIMTDATSNTT